MIGILPYLKSKKRARPSGPALFLILSMIGAMGCSILAERPVQLMSDTAAALKAAKEVSADSLAPEKYRKAAEAYFKARNEYRLKNFAIAKDYATQAKKLAEEAEFDALKQGSSRASLLPPELPAGPPPPSEIIPPTGELATEVMKREDAALQAPPPAAGAPPDPTPGSGALGP